MGRSLVRRHAGRPATSAPTGRCANERTETATSGTVQSCSSRQQKRSGGVASFRGPQASTMPVDCRRARQPPSTGFKTRWILRTADAHLRPDPRSRRCWRARAGQGAGTDLGSIPRRRGCTRNCGIGWRVIGAVVLQVQEERGDSDASDGSGHRLGLSGLRRGGSNLEVAGHTVGSLGSTQSAGLTGECGEAGPRNLGGVSATARPGLTVRVA